MSQPSHSAGCSRKVTESLAMIACKPAGHQDDGSGSWPPFGRTRQDPELHGKPGWIENIIHDVPTLSVQRRTDWPWDAKSFRRHIESVVIIYSVCIWRRERNEKSESKLHACLWDAEEYLFIQESRLKDSLLHLIKTVKFLHCGRHNRSINRWLMYWVRMWVSEWVNEWEGVKEINADLGDLRSSCRRLVVSCWCVEGHIVAHPSGHVGSCWP